MSRQPRMQIDSRDGAKVCYVCGCWPAPVVVDSKRRICEGCQDLGQAQPLQ